MSRSTSKFSIAGIFSALVFCTFFGTALASTPVTPHNVVINLDREEDYNTGILAIFTCSLHGKEYVVSACLASSNGFVGGTLKVISGAYIKLFPQFEVADSLGYNMTSFHLHQHFRIRARTASVESGLVLRLTVKDGFGKILYEDDTERFNSISLSND